MITEEIKQFLSSIGKKGGKATSQAKRRAVRANGKLGGRPPKKKVVAKLTRQE